MNPNDNESFAETWDAGEMGCGELLIKLKFKLNLIAVGREIKVIARDTGAIEDLPSWCRLTRNKLVKLQHPVYVIKKGE